MDVEQDGYTYLVVPIGENGTEHESVRLTFLQRDNRTNDIFVLQTSVKACYTRREYTLQGLIDSTSLTTCRTVNNQCYTWSDWPDPIID